MKYCQITFVYSPRGGMSASEYSGNATKLRYIPVEEMNECYFILCRDPNCPNLKTHKIHPWGIKGCRGCKEWNICDGNGCQTDKEHLFGHHKKCKGSRKARTYNKYNPLPFLEKYTTETIPKDEKVYHFNYWRFENPKPRYWENNEDYKCKHCENFFPKHKLDINSKVCKTCN
jgi:hypothetical protein